MHILGLKPLPGLVEEQIPAHHRIGLVGILPSAGLKLAFDQNSLQNNKKYEIIPAVCT